MHSMRIRLSLLIVLAAAALTWPAGAGAAIPRNRLLLVQQGSSMAEVYSMSTLPLGFTSTARQAIRAAEHDPALIALHRRMHPLRVVPYVWRAVHPYWDVVITHRGKIVGAANVSPSG